MMPHPPDEANMTNPSQDQVKTNLIHAIKSGNCLAFIGAGMSAPLAPAWYKLLNDLLARLPSSTIPQMKESENAFTLESTAQIISDEFRTIKGENGLNHALTEIFRTYETSRPNDLKKNENRYKKLREFPFKGILTTNFDTLLKGKSPDASEFAHLHSHRRPTWFSDPPVLKLHGQIEDTNNPPILAREDYRRRVYEGRGDYLALLKALFATHPVVFIGTSFTDAYLNELRSEVFSWFTRRKNNQITTEGHPGWYAILPDANEQRRAYFNTYEGIQVISYTPGPNYEGFDVVFDELHQTLSHTTRLKERLQGKTIVWHDSATSNNKKGIQILKEAGIPVYTPRNVEETLTQLSHTEINNTILISYFGGDIGTSALDDLVNGLREKKTFVPLIVFGSDQDIHARRLHARRLGALDYTYEWPDCFRIIDELLESDDEHNHRIGLKKLGVASPA
jgi:hypothetical protein